MWSPIPEPEIAAVRTTFDMVASARFRDFILNLRKRSAERAGLDVFGPACAQFAPHSVTADVWGKLCTHWFSDGWQRKSAAGKSNRAKQETVHVGGSITFSEHLRRMVSNFSN